MIIFLILLIAAALILQFCMAKRALGYVRCSIRIERYLVEPGEPVEVMLIVQNLSRLPALFLECSCQVPVDAVPHGLKRGKLVTYVQTARYVFHCFLMPRQRIEHRFMVSFPTRGARKFEDLRVAAGDFFGLREREKRVVGSSSAVVMPKKLPGRDARELAGGIMGERSVRRWLFEDPILSVGFNEYTGNEPWKSISWQRSLQSGRLMVRRMDHTAEERVTVLFSVWEADYDHIEDCFSLCRSVVESLEEQRLPFAFLHNGLLRTPVGILPVVEAGLGELHRARILEALGRADPGASGNLASLVDRAIARARESCCYILITARSDGGVRQQARRLEAQSGAGVHIVSLEGAV